MQEQISKHRPSYFTPKIKFTPYEDILLKNACMLYGVNNWRLISMHVPGRNPRQCRERWNNYVNPEMLSIPWTPAEDALLLSKYNEIGSQWKLISSFFKGKSTNNIKNRFAKLMRKANKNNRKMQKNAKQVYTKDSESSKLEVKKSPQTEHNNTETTDIFNVIEPIDFEMIMDEWQL